jgi:hypothetical protein
MTWKKNHDYVAYWLYYICVTHKMIILLLYLCDTQNDYTITIFVWHTKSISVRNRIKYHYDWFSPGTPVSSTSKTDHHDITEILLKVALNTITLPPFYDCQKRMDQ